MTFQSKRYKYWKSLLNCENTPLQSRKIAKEMVGIYKQQLKM